MNCPSRTDDVDGREGWNQSPNLLAGTTREDFNGRANTIFRRRIDPDGPSNEVPLDQLSDVNPPSKNGQANATVRTEERASGSLADPSPPQSSSGNPATFLFHQVRKVAVKYCKFIGPGFMVRKVTCKEMRPATYSSRSQLHILIQAIIQPMSQPVAPIDSSSCLLFSCQMLSLSIFKPFASS